ncbi:MAG: hypothetical protein WCE44_14020 [Candidatus Velthaea sp.]
MMIETGNVPIGEADALGFALGGGSDGFGFGLATGDEGGENFGFGLALGPLLLGWGLGLAL